MGASPQRTGRLQRRRGEDAAPGLRAGPPLEVLPGSPAPGELPPPLRSGQSPPLRGVEPRPSLQRRSGLPALRSGAEAPPLRLEPRPAFRLGAPRSGKPAARRRRRAPAAEMARAEDGAAAACGLLESAGVLWGFEDRRIAWPTEGFVAAASICPHHLPVLLWG